VIAELILAKPVSAASISQVHFAVTREDPADGGADVSGSRDVAVKVLRPGIERAFRRDLALFYWLAHLAERTQPRLRRFKPVAVVREFEEIVGIEMDLAMEAAAASELAENFEGDETYRTPPIDWRRTSRRVLTMGRISGIRIDNRAALLAAGLDLGEILTKAAGIFFNQVFRDGFFHGDQHPGNMFVDPDGNIVAVDFGIMGRLDQQTRTFLAEMLLAQLARDYRRIDPNSARIVLIEAGPRLLAGFPPALSENARRSLEKLGVEVKLGQAVTQVDDDGVMLGAERIGELDAHMPKTAEPDHANLVALADLPVRQRRPGGDARAEQRRHGARIEIFRKAQHELVAHDDMFRIPAIGRAAQMHVPAAIGRR